MNNVGNMVRESYNLYYKARNARLKRHNERGVLAKPGQVRIPTHAEMGNGVRG